MQINPPYQRQSILAAIVDDSEDAIISKSLESRITSWNKAAERIFGYTEQEMIGELIYKLIPPERHKEEIEIIRQLKAGNRIEHFETVRLTKSGRRLQISLTVSPIRDSTGKVIGAAKIARDITRKKQYEESLNLINELGKSINAQLNVNVVLQIVSDAATRMSNAAFGFFLYNNVNSAGENVLTSAVSGTLSDKQEDFKVFARPSTIFQSAFNGSKVVRSRDIRDDQHFGPHAIKVNLAEQQQQMVSYMAVPVVSRGGFIAGGLFFGHPEPGVFNEEHENLVLAIAAQAAIALDNARMYEEVNTLNAKKDQFISFASHELKTPLTTLKGYLQLGHKNKMSLADIYPKVEKQINRLEEIITDLLDVSLISAGKFEISISKTNIADIIALSIDSLMLQKHHLNIQNPLNALEVWVDKAKMVQVLTNMLTNAAKYSANDSTIWLNTSLADGQVLISVRDEGMGIPSQHLKDIFNQFYRVSHPSSKAKGAGLGLYISKEILEAHSGKIWAESVVGEGSTFYIQFPATHNS